MGRTLLGTEVPGERADTMQFVGSVWTPENQYNEVFVSRHSFPKLSPQILLCPSKARVCVAQSKELRGDPEWGENPSTIMPQRSLSPSDDKQALWLPFGGPRREKPSRALQ